jgi:Outer membrane protein beta-barrel domain
MKTIVLYTLTAILISSSVSVAQAQSDPPKFEVGGQFSVLNFERFTAFGDNRRNELGGGGRFTFNFNKYVAAETQVDFFPQEDSVRIGTIDVPLWGNKTLAVFGVKAGGRSKRVGVFGKARPGFIHFSSVPLFFCVISSNPCPQANHTSFALDLGGVFEYYPSPRTVLRFDAGDTIIRHDKQFFGTSHSFQTSVGAGFRF